MLIIVSVSGFVQKSYWRCQLWPSFVIFFTDWPVECFTLMAIVFNFVFHWY